MKKILWTTAVLTLLLAACGNNEESEADTPVTEEPTEEVEPEEPTDGEMEDEEDAAYNPEDQMVDSIADMEPIPLEEYDEDKWAFFDSRETGELVESAVFAEGERLYMGSQRDSVIALDYDTNIFWEDTIAATGFQTEIAMDDTHIYNPSMTGRASSKNYIAAISKETGERNYQIDLSEYGEMSETLVDDDAFYLALGINENEDEDYLAETFTLHKFDKATGETVWETEISGIRLGHGRSSYYVLQQNDELVFLLERNENDIIQIVARSKEDGAPIWTTEIGSEDDRKDGARLGRIYYSNGAIYTMDGYDIIHVFDAMTGEKITEHPFNGYMPGGMVPLPVVHEDLFIWQHGTEDYHHLKVVNPKSGEDLWVMDLDGYFLVDFNVIGDTLYAVIGSLDFDAEENTMMARIDPYTGEVLDLMDLGASISAKVNNQYVHKGMTKHNDTLVYFFDNLVYIYNEQYKE